MHVFTRNLILGLMTLVATAAAQSSMSGSISASAPAADGALQVARVSAAGKLQKPEDLQNWVFLGASLGMGYNPGSFNAANPGQIQVVLMEPTAHRYFVQHGRFAAGSMFLLSFYNTAKQSSIDRNGFTQEKLTNYEIHVIEPRSDAKRHSFYMFGASDTQGNPVPPGNACVTCHEKHGAFDGTFAQFYPTIRPLIPKDALERALQDHNIQ